MDLIINVLKQTLRALQHNYPYLAVGLIMAATLQVYLNPGKIKGFLARHSGKSSFLAVLFATLTPFCSCGTMAVVIAMMASTVPWAPVVAFMVSSPLMSPSVFVYATGVMGLGFAVALLTASILIGLGAGWIAGILEKRGFLKNQGRFVTPTVAETACACSNEPVAEAAPAAPGFEECRCGETPWRRAVRRLKLGTFGNALLSLTPRLLFTFTGFAAIGYLIASIFPTEWLIGLFGQGKFYGVPLAATMGLPLYLNTEASVPLVQSLIEAGMSQGAALAFTIAGAGTSLGAIAGALTIARKRVVAVVVGSLWLGAIVAGYAYNAVLALL